MSFIAAAIGAIGSIGVGGGLALGAGAALIGGAISSRGAQHAADTQAQSANQASATQLQMFNQTRDDQAPWRQAGANALGAISGGVGLGPEAGGIPSGYFNHQFNRDDLNASLAPNYQFMLEQGQGAVTNQANAMGGLGGNSLADISRYTTGYAQNAYQQAYANYTANQTNIFNRLSAISGLGQTAGSNQTTGGSTYGGNIGSSLIGAGNARAAGIVGSSNAISGALTNAASWYGSMNSNPFAGASAGGGTGP